MIYNSIKITFFKLLAFLKQLLKVLSQVVEQAESY